MCDLLRILTIVCFITAIVIPTNKASAQSADETRKFIVEKGKKLVCDTYLTNDEGQLEHHNHIENSLTFDKKNVLIIKSSYERISDLVGNGNKGLVTTTVYECVTKDLNPKRVVVVKEDAGPARTLGRLGNCLARMRI